MKINKLFILAVALGILQTGISQKASKDFEIIKLDDGIYAAIHKPGGNAICNAGIIDLGDATLIFDPFLSPYAAEELKRVVAEMGLKPVKYVVNSHFHNDHIRGNQVFEDAFIYSNLITKQLMEKSEPEEIADENENLPKIIAKSDSMLAAVPVNDTMQKKQIGFMNSYFKTILESHKVLRTVLPNKIIIDKETINGKKQSVVLITMGMGHTQSDLILLVPGKKIMFTGDLLFIDNHPWILDGDLDSLKTCLYKMKAMNSNIIVPGHGPVGNNQDIENLIKYLDNINEVAELQVKNGMKPAQVKEVKIPEAYKNWTLVSFYLPNIKFQMKHILAMQQNMNK